MGNPINRFSHVSRRERNEGRGLTMNIVICEDDDVQAEQIQKLMEQFKSEFAIRCKTAEEVLHAIRQGTKFGLYLFDIQLPGVNGLELARQIKEKQPHALVALITAYSQYITTALTIDCCQYFVKPIEEAEFIPPMRKLLCRCNEELLTFILDTERPMVMNLRDVIYVEFYHGTMKVKYFNKEKLQEYKPKNPKIKVQKERLLDRGFLRCHQGYFVNPMYVRRIEEKEVVCSKNIRVPISVRKYAAVKEGFLEYMNGRY